MLAAVISAVSTFYEEPAGAVGPGYDLRGADSVDLVELVVQTEATLRESGFAVRVDDDTIGGWDDVAGFAGNVRDQLRVVLAAGSTSPIGTTGTARPAAQRQPAREQHGVDRPRS